MGEHFITFVAPGAPAESAGGGIAPFFGTAKQN